MRFLPKTLFGRILLAMFCGLLAVQAVGVWLMLEDRARFGERLLGEYVAQRIAGILGILDDAPPAERTRLIRALSTAPIRLSLDEPWQEKGTEDSDEAKEEKFIAFGKGDVRVLITKPKIGAWGLNFQHCNRVTFFPSHSFEQYYQGVRRCWRFGQKRPVTVDVVTTEGEKSVMKNLQRKAVAADKMFSTLVGCMAEAQSIDREIKFTKQEEVPKWL